MHSHVLEEVFSSLPLAQAVQLVVEPKHSEQGEVHVIQLLLPELTVFTK